MGNFKDFTRAIAGIATALKDINTVVDDIPVPEPPTPPVASEWVHVTNTSNTVASFNMDDVTDGVSIGIKNTAGMTPAFFPKKLIESFGSSTKTFALWGANFSGIEKIVFNLAVSEGVCTLTITGSSTVDSTYRVWDVYIK